MANKIVSLLIVVIGTVLGLSVQDIFRSYPLAWTMVFISLLLAYLNLNKNFFKLK